MPIQVCCPCGKVLSVPDSMAGKKGRCPACKKPLTVPSGRDASASSAQQCPSCGKHYEPDIVICIPCGIKLATGEKLQTRTG